MACIRVSHGVDLYLDMFFAEKINQDTFLVGKPIHVDTNLNATSEEIDQLHREYIQSVEQLFEFNKDRYGLGHVKLKIV